ncbi:MAG: DUF58 domain-containing protein [Burkholderiaceae bacterium]
MWTWLRKPEPGAAGGKAERVLARLEWTVLRRLDGQLQGEHRSLFRGAGLDLCDLREYQFHDDVRHIDWNVTARLDTPYVRQYTESRELDVWFLIDLSASVGFGSGEVGKHTLARDFSAALARLFTRQGNRVGAALYRGADEPAAASVLPARGGRNQVLALLHRIEATPLQAAGPTELASFFDRAAGLIRRRSLVFAISDYQSRPGWPDALGRLALRHEVIAVRLVDPLERALPDLGILVLEDAETGEQLQVDTHLASFRRRFAEASERREAALEQGFAQAGVDALELATDEDLADAVLRFARLRKLHGRSAAGAAR